MPVLFPAHQGLIAGVKLRWPRYVDGTALCVGAATPDLGYGFGGWLNEQSHAPLGILVWGIPFSIAAVLLIRWRAAVGIFAHLPDLGPLRLRSFQVLGQRRPRWVVAAPSAVIGIASHVVIDAFTHQQRWGAQLAGLDSVLFTAPVRGGITGARVLQYLGHTLGSVLSIVLLLVVARGGHLENWYGRDAVQAARAARPRRDERVVFWTVALAPPLVTVARFIAIGQSPLFPALTVLTIAVLVAGTVTRRPFRATAAAKHSRA